MVRLVWRLQLGSGVEAHCLRLWQGPRKALGLPFVHLLQTQSPKGRLAVGRTAPSRMEALGAVLLTLLLCQQPAELTGHRLAQEDEEDVKSESYGYDDDDEEEEEDETNMIFSSKDRVSLECYACSLLKDRERCQETKRCSSSQTFCTTMVSHGRTDSGFLTTYSMWCTDSCRPLTKTVEGTQINQTCCQSTLCNAPPWQRPPQGGRAGQPQGGRAGGPREDGPGSSRGSGAPGFPGCPKSMGIAFLLPLLASLWTVGA
ncbi:glycosylphosphatidylinositol-anchored high density lipoprotein-binding protein 1-like [Dipodomys merriami]|uniref:glycosylphosphatidylinositol-anchored high density lipoprotein-binding protein 1-like n=2 Tax=Dipodomys merriami TaxID=94247 RepID=UPI00385588E6